MAVGDERIHKQVVLEWLNQMARDYPKMALEGVVGCFQEEFDYWPDEADDDRSAPSPGFRRTDPDTSRQAALDAYPRASTHRRYALNAIIRSGATGMTYYDVEKDTGINGVWKRLSELKQGGFIKHDGDRVRVVPKTGSNAEVYVATKKALRLFAENR